MWRYIEGFQPTNIELAGWFLLLFHKYLEYLFLQQSLERQKTAEKERLFLVYAKQWWREFLEIRPSHQNKLVKIFAQVGVKGWMLAVVYLSFVFLFEDICHSLKAVILYFQAVLLQKDWS